MHVCKLPFPQARSCDLTLVSLVIGKSRNNQDVVTSTLHKRKKRVYPLSHETNEEVLHTLSLVPNTRKQALMMMIMMTEKKPSGTIDKKRKTLSFHDKVNIRFTITRQELSQQEHHDAWYSREEYKTISEACSKQISEMDLGEILSDCAYCVRGLEVHTRIRTLSKGMNRSLAYQVVLDEQRRQCQDGVVLDVALARFYHACSSSSQFWAHTVGLADQREADEIQDESDEHMTF